MRSIQMICVCDNVEIGKTPQKLGYIIQPTLQSLKLSQRQEAKRP